MTSVNRPLALAARWLLKTLLRPLFYLAGFRVVGGERLPGRREPLILAANHAALIDSVYLTLALRPRLTGCGARRAYFATTPRRALMGLANILEVESKEQFLADCGTLLEAGEVLLIYPEMARNPRGLGEFLPWAAEVALAHRVPILPCYLHGTSEGHLGPPRLIVGDRIEPKGEPQTLTSRVRRAIVALAPAGSVVAEPP